MFSKYLKVFNYAAFTIVECCLVIESHLLGQVRTRQLESWCWKK